MCFLHWSVGFENSGYYHRERLIGVKGKKRENSLKFKIGNPVTFLIGFSKLFKLKVKLFVILIEKTG